MQKSLNKLWTILTLGMMCILIFCIFAGGAARRSKKALEGIERIQQQLDLLSATSKALEFRIEKIEKSLTDSRKLENPKEPSDIQSDDGKVIVNPPPSIGSNNSQKVAAKPPRRVQNSNNNNNNHSSDMQKTPVISIGQQMILEFKDSLNDEQLEELSNRIDESVYESVSIAADQVNLSIEPEERFIQSLGSKLDLIKSAKEDAVLMQMMAEQTQLENS